MGLLPGVLFTCMTSYHHATPRRHQHPSQHHLHFDGPLAIDATFTFFTHWKQTHQFSVFINMSQSISPLRHAVSILSEEIQAVVAALVGGARYGLKIRTPHALVMTMIFRRDLTSKEKLRTILQLALEHAGNLAAFATIYKTTLTSLKWTSTHLRRRYPWPDHDDVPSKSNGSIRYYFQLSRILGRALVSLLVDGPVHDPPPTALTAPPGHAEHAYHAFVAGALSGYYIWGRYSSVNYQIVLYLTSRVLVGLWKRLHQSSSLLSTQCPEDTYPWAAAVVWGLTMALFEESPDVLHPSLKSSMDEIYRSRLSWLSPRTDNSGGEASDETVV